MSAEDEERKLSASVVCNQCKKRKKSCSKTLPSCSRCSRFMVKCTYATIVPPANSHPLPPVFKFVPAPLQAEVLYQGLGVDAQVSAQALRLLDAISRKSWPMDVFVSSYFNTFHRSLPILNQDAFRAQLQQPSPSPHFSTLLLSMILISHLSSQIGNGERKAGEELYPTLKSIYGLLLGSGSVTIELLQAGIIIAAYEYCQALSREAWLGIGNCARLGQVLGLHHMIRLPMPEKVEKRDEFETQRCLWWGIVVLERIINISYEHNRLPFASQAPSLGDYLPLVPAGGSKSFPLSTDLITPDITESGIELFNRLFTRLGNFSSTIQVTYLSSLLTHHITDTIKSYEEKEVEARRIDFALQSYACTLFPPPGMAEGSYCGAFGLRTLEAFTLHENSLAVATTANDDSGIARAKLGLQSLSRTTIDMTKMSVIGRPLDFDTLAFWAPGFVVKAALWHIKLGERDDEWEKGLEVLKTYLKWLAPRFRIYENALGEIEEEEKLATEKMVEMPYTPPLT